MSNEQVKAKPARRKFLTGAAAATAGAATLGFPMIGRTQSPIVIKMQGSWGSADIFNEMAQEYVKRVNEMSGGRLRIDYLLAGAVVKPFEVMDAVAKGVLDGGHTARVVGKAAVAVDRDGRTTVARAGEHASLNRVAVNVDVVRQDPRGGDREQLVFAGGTKCRIVDGLGRVIDAGNGDGRRRRVFERLSGAVERSILDAVDKRVLPRLTGAQCPHRRRGPQRRAVPFRRGHPHKA